MYTISNTLSMLYSNHNDDCIYSIEEPKGSCASHVCTLNCIREYLGGWKLFYTVYTVEGGVITLDPAVTHVRG